MNLKKPFKGLNQNFNKWKITIKYIIFNMSQNINVDINGEQYNNPQFYQK